ncbi:PREDICTED: transcriptional regulator TAC1 [Nelumbo nucifera]|uniref:C2H2-type domain-containing protein n=2 Tax=Nelumbo nucifera TaxID=4432 RepID=A0A822Y640_NELNU|nr:PREDICTED: transcriptional regulator TAC1 [Nelumbo nucifera]DAD26515.1 TPA_asm: hypothetical protein HUJ06_027983 [Nelumbo nucifera]
METDRPSPEISDQVAGSSDEQGPSPARSYECTFCKRGFSNAQALGGHMNIHRRDRAKLKQPSNIRSHLTLDIAKKIPSSHPQLSSGYDSSPILESREERSGSSLNWTWIVNREEDVAAARQQETHVGELRQLSLFEETPSDGEHRQSSSDGHEERMQSTDGYWAREEPDLELRLGPEPQDTSTTGTIEFF